MKAFSPSTSSQTHLFFLFLLLSFVRGDLAAVSRDTSLLLSFKKSLPNPGVLQNWDDAGDACQFTGVTCTAGRVSSLDFTNLQLSAELRFVAAFLMGIDRLEFLYIQSTNVTGAVSSVSTFRCGASLSVLDLANNSVYGSISDLGNLLSSCSSLKSLNMSRNNLGFAGVGDSGGVFFSGLEVLDLSYNRISGENVVGWVLSGGCRQLKSLSLKRNNVNGSIPISGCGKLEYLDVSFNNFSTFPSLGRCSSLKYLDLSANKFSGEIKNQQLSYCQQLNHLNLSSNRFTGDIPALPTANLQYVYLSGNDFQGGIPPLLAASCRTLLELNLSSNNLSGTVPTNFQSCFSLVSIDISRNNFSGNLPVDTLLKWTNLKKLSISYNNFVGFLPESLSELTNLETLDVSSNNFSGQIPAGLCGDRRNSLKELHLQNNMFTGRIPDSLSNCSQLVSLDLSFNYLTGTIPSSLGSLSKLQHLMLWLNKLHGQIPEQLKDLKTLENLILDFNELTGPIPDGLSNCTNLNWISLSNNLLTGQIPGWIGKLSNLAILKLGNNSFYGSIPPELGDCRSLIWLDLNTNNLTGTIPPELFKQSSQIPVGLVTGKSYVYIRNDGSKRCHGAGNLLEYAGIREEEMDRISTRNPCNFTRVYKGRTDPTFNHNGSMIFLDLSYNMLGGSIPKELGSPYYLYILNLAHNNLSGSIPEELGGLKNVNILDFSYNSLQGTIPPSLSGLSMLTEIDLSNNNLSGMIPQSGQFPTFSNLSFGNNSGLCGLPLSSSCGANANSVSSTQHERSHRRQASLVGSVAMGLLFSLFCIFGLIVVAIETRKRRKKKDSTLDVYIDGNSHSGNATVNWKVTGAREALSINLATFEKPLRKLTFADLLEATNGFHNDSLIGSGGFGDVYKAQLKDGSIVAIKKLIHISGQGDREFTAEMETIGKIKHRNLVPLLGYCKVGEERLLVYEYMRFGSLEDILHDRKKAGIKLNWAARRKIAIGSARGLAFLHHNCIPHIIHRDMKSSNVLIDENLEARVSDFGMARLMSAMDTHLSVSTLAGTPGYVPPEYYQSFRCSTKGDVYSYGVVLLELLTGKQPTDSADFGDNNLVGWVKQHAKLRISDVFDPELMKEDPNLEIELLQHLKVACACLDDRPWRRPTMIQVMAMFKEIQAGSGLDSSSTITTEDGFSAVDMVEMSIKEAPEFSKQ